MSEETTLDGSPLSAETHAILRFYAKHGYVVLKVNPESAASGTKE